IPSLALRAKVSSRCWTNGVRGTSSVRRRFLVVRGGRCEYNACVVLPSGARCIETPEAGPAAGTAKRFSSTNVSSPWFALQVLGAQGESPRVERARCNHHGGKLKAPIRAAPRSYRGKEPEMKCAASLCILAVAIALLGLPSPACASPLYLVEESFGPGFDILLKYDAGVLTTVGRIGFDQVRGIAYDATTGNLFAVPRGDYGPRVPYLITIDPNTGMGTRVGAAPYLPPGSNTAEISVSAAGNVFGLGHLNDLTRVDTLLRVD